MYYESSHNLQNTVTGPCYNTAGPVHWRPGHEFDLMKIFDQSQGGRQVGSGSNHRMWESF
jgi:hypothetical protein